jgi:Arylsulfotransferase (ASST)
MVLRQIRTALAPALAAIACVCTVAVCSAQAASTPPIGAFTTKGTWKFLSRPDLHPPKLSTLVTANTKKLAPGYFMITNFKNLRATDPMVGQGGPLILDNKLSPVWFGPVSTNVVAGNLKAQTYQGKPVLSWWEGVVSPLGATVSGKDVVFSQQYKRVATLTGKDGWVISLHEMLIAGHDAWVTAYRVEQANLSSVPGGSPSGQLEDSAIQEYDLKTGKLVKTWDALQHIPLTDSEAALPASPAVPWDAYHVNAINSVGGGKFIVSMRNTWAAYLVDTNTGNIEWTLGGKHSTFKLGPGASFEWQHDVEMHKGNVISVFDDACCAIGATVGPPSGPTRGLVLNLNTSAKTATLSAQYTRGPKFNAAFLGNADVLPNGNVAIGWGSQPFFSEVSKSGKVLLDAGLPNPNVNYRTYVQGWVGKPWRAPNGVVRKGKHGALVFASWNGATQLAAWRVLAGRDAKHLAVVVSSKNKTSFETAIPLAATYRKYKVQALDANGRVLGSSGAFPTSTPPSTLPPGY